MQGVCRRQVHRRHSVHREHRLLALPGGEILQRWCCVHDERFKKTAGVVPYLLPPLEGQTDWRGDPELSWAAEALAAAFQEANQTDMASEMRGEMSSSSRSSSTARHGKGKQRRGSGGSNQRRHPPV